MAEPPPVASASRTGGSTPPLAELRASQSSPPRGFKSATRKQSSKQGGKSREAKSESEDDSSYLDSLEEGRTPLLLRNDDAILDEEECEDERRGGNGRRIHRRPAQSDYHTNDGDETLPMDSGCRNGSRIRRIPRERHKAAVSSRLLIVY